MIVYDTQKKLWPKNTLMLTSRCMVDLETFYINTHHHVNSAPCHDPDTKDVPNEMFENGQVGTWVFVGFVCTHFISPWQNLSFLFPC